MPDTTATKPLDAERARLRAKGWDDEDITKILMQAEAQSLAQQQLPTGTGSVAGQSMSGVLSSLVAVGTYLRDTVFTVRKDVEILFASNVSSSVRAGATASLAVKVALIFVLGFAAWQEWQQHIIYGTETARAKAKQATAEACAATGTVVPLNNLRDIEEWKQEDRKRRPECYHDTLQSAAPLAYSDFPLGIRSAIWLGRLALMAAFGAFVYVKTKNKVEDVWKVFATLNVVLFSFVVFVDQILIGKSNWDEYLETTLAAGVVTFALWLIERRKKAKATATAAPETAI